MKSRNIDFETLLLNNLNNGIYGKHLLWHERGYSFKIKVKNSTHSSWSELDHKVYADRDVMQGRKYPKTAKEFTASRRRWFASLSKIAKFNRTVKPYKYYNLKEPCSSEVRPVPKEINQTNTAVSLIVLPTVVVINPTPPNKDTSIYVIMNLATSPLLQIPWGNKDTNQEENSNLQNEFMGLSKSNDSSGINKDVMVSGQDSLTESVELDRTGQYQVKTETEDIKENDHLRGQYHAMGSDISFKPTPIDDFLNKNGNRINESMNIDPNFNMDVSGENVGNQEQAADIDFNDSNWMYFKFPANMDNGKHTITAATDLGLDLMSTAQDQAITRRIINYFGNDFPAKPSEGMKEQLDFPKENNINNSQSMEETDLHNLNEDSLFTPDNEKSTEKGNNPLLTEEKEAEFLLQDEEFINDLLSEMN